jgi:hypothetical protein
MITQTARRIAFADELKKVVKRRLGLPPDFDEKKFKDRRIRDRMSFRDFCIQIGEAKKKGDPHYWAKKAFKDYVDGDVLVTDWRFQSELDYVQSLVGPENVVTIRLFRQGAPVPDDDDPIEHQLDRYTPDYLIVPLKKDSDQVALATKRINPVFSQYDKCDYYLDHQYIRPVKKGQ